MDCQHVDIEEHTAAGTAAYNNYYSRDTGACSHCTQGLAVGTVGDSDSDCNAASFPYHGACFVALPADDRSSYRLGVCGAVPI